MEAIAPSLPHSLLSGPAFGGLARSFYWVILCVITPGAKGEGEVRSSMVHLACQYHLLLFDPPAPRSPLPSDKKHFYGNTHFGVPCAYDPNTRTFMVIVLTEEVKDIFRSCQHMCGPRWCFEVSAKIGVCYEVRMGSVAPLPRISPRVPEDATPAWGCVSTPCCRFLFVEAQETFSENPAKPAALIPFTMASTLKSSHSSFIVFSISRDLNIALLV